MNDFCKYIVIVSIFIFNSAHANDDTIQLKQDFLKVIAKETEKNFILVFTSSFPDTEIDENTKNHFKDISKKIASENYIKCIEGDSYGNNRKSTSIFYREVVKKKEFPPFIQGRANEIYQLIDNAWLQQYSITKSKGYEDDFRFHIAGEAQLVDNDTSYHSRSFYVEYNNKKIYGEPARTLFEMYLMVNRSQKCFALQMETLKKNK